MSSDNSVMIICDHSNFYTWMKLGKDHEIIEVLTNCDPLVEIDFDF